jgi:cholesterol oxidase
MQTPRRLARSLDSLRPHYDAVVVGSGYGGGVAAARLARAGKRVAVLERGQELLTGEFPRRFPELREQMQVTGRRVRMGSPTGLYDVRLGDDMHILVGCGLGGGSLINAGVALRPDARVLRDSVWPEEVAQDGLIEEGFARAERWVRPAHDPHAAERTKYRALAQSLTMSGAALGRGRLVAAPVTVSFEDTVNPAGIAQPACTRCGDCCGGCNAGSKNTVALTYLPEAARHGAEIFTHAKVRRVAQAAAKAGANSSDGRWEVHLQRLDQAKPGAGNGADGLGALRVTADIVVLAAGTLGSTEILLRSREAGLAVSDRLGQRFSANGDIIAFGYGGKTRINAIGVGHPPRLEGLDVGATVSGQIEIVDETELANSLTIQEGVLPSALAPLLPVLFIPNGRLLGALQSLVSGVYKGPFANLQTFFAVSHDSAAGRLVLEDDRITVSWPRAGEEPVYARLDKALSLLVEAVGGSYVKNPLAGTMMGRQPATAHPLGGCGMGRDRGEGVIDHRCRVFDAGAASGAADVHRGLYVMDGSIMPRSLGVNPLLTITALSERAMLLMAEEWGLEVRE